MGDRGRGWAVRGVRAADGTEEARVREHQLERELAGKAAEGPTVEAAARVAAV